MVKTSSEIQMGWAFNKFVDSFDTISNSTVNIESESHSVTFQSLQILEVHGNLQARILEWVAFPFPRGSSQPRDWTQVSRIAGGFFTSWATREAQEYWSGWPTPSPGALPNPRIESGSPALQAYSLPTELSGKPKHYINTDTSQVCISGPDLSFDLHTHASLQLDVW